MNALIDQVDQWLPGFGVAAPLILPLILLFVVFALLRRIPVIGPVISLISWVVLIGLVIAAIGQRERFDPAFARLLGPLAGQSQQVVGKETRIPMARDGHFWATVSLNGVERRMLIDSGATVTAISEQTARQVGVRDRKAVMPIILRTVNGAVTARHASVETLRVGNARASDVAVVVSPSLGDMDVLGMNFLSRLKGWRVEGRTLILEPHHPQATGA